jgi:hypothetical protein
MVPVFSLSSNVWVSLQVENRVCNSDRRAYSATFPTVVLCVQATIGLSGLHLVQRKDEVGPVKIAYEMLYELVNA